METKTTWFYEGHQGVSFCTAESGRGGQGEPKSRGEISADLIGRVRQHPDRQDVLVIEGGFPKHF